MLKLLENKALTQNNRRKVFKAQVRRGLPKVLGWALIGLAVGLTSKYNHDYIYGQDGKGGELISLKSKLSDEDMEYNRQLQKFIYLLEPTHGYNFKEQQNKYISVKTGEGNYRRVGKMAPHFSEFE